MLTRAQKREETRTELKKMKKLSNWLLKLNKEQRELLSDYCIEATKSDIIALQEAYIRVLRPLLHEGTDGDIETAEKILNDIISKVEQEGLAIRKFENGSVGYMANLKKEKDNIISKYKKFIQSGLNEKESYEELKTAYPMFTASALKNTIAEYKRDKKQEKQETSIDINPNMSTEEIASAIINHVEESKPKKQPDTEEKQQESKIIRQDKKEALQSVSDVQNSTQKSKLIEITKVREFKGEYGEYKKKVDGTIIAGDLEFKNVKDIEDCKNQVDKDLELERQEFEKKISEKRIKALGRLNEVIELLSM